MIRAFGLLIRRGGPPLGGAALLLLVGCGAGSLLVSLGIVDDDSSRGGANNSLPSVSSAVSISSTQSSPALIEFSLIDAESDRVNVDLLFRVPLSTGSITGRPTLVPGMATVLDSDDNPAFTVEVTPQLVGLETSPGGRRHFKLWNFARDFSELGIDAPLHIIDLFLAITPEGTLPEASPEQGPSSEHGTATVVLGNEPPRLCSLPIIDPEVSGIVAVPLRVMDTTADTVEITVEFRILPTEDCAVCRENCDWRLASPAEGEQNPVDTDGELMCPAPPEVFFWDSQLDLSGTTEDVQLRLTLRERLTHPEDTPLVVEEEPFCFRIDNNEAPTAFLAGGSLAANDDRRAGIPIPFTVVDPESDDVELVFQWRRVGQSFEDPADGLELPQSPDALGAILADPELRRQFQIASEAARETSGQVVSTGRLSSVRLPELARSGQPLLPGEVEGQLLETLRPRNSPEFLDFSPTLRMPVAAAVIDATRAVVLDRPTNSGWRLVEIALTSVGPQQSAKPITEGVGTPVALDLEPSRTHAVIALQDEGDVTVVRVGLGNGQTSEFAFPGLARKGDVKDLLPLGGAAWAATRGSDVVLLITGARTIQLATLVDPVGLARNPSTVNGILVADRGGTMGRTLVSLDLATREVRFPFSHLEVPAPDFLDVDASENRLVLQMKPPGSPPVVASIPLSRRQLTERFAVSGAASSLVTGVDGLIVLTLPEQNGLAVAGGTGHVSRIDSFDPTTQIVTVADSWIAPPRPFAPWRIRRFLGRIRATPSGRSGIFLWDTSELPNGGEVVVRVLPFDSESGIGQELDLSLTLDPPLGSQNRAITVEGVPGIDDQPAGLHAADLDGDSLEDVVTANGISHTLTIFRSELEADGSVNLPTGSDVTITIPGFAGGTGPKDVTAADFNGDGKLDLASANGAAGTVTIVLQPGTRFFASTQGPDATLRSPREDIQIAPAAVVAADFDGDGSIDLASANEDTERRDPGSVTIFLNGRPGFGFLPQQAADLLLGNVLDVTDDVESIVAADFNQDGLLDVATANADSDNLTLFFQDERWFRQDIIRDPDTVLSSIHTDDCRSLVASDLDFDGALDLASANLATDGVVAANFSLFYQTRIGVFGQAGTKPDVTNDPNLVIPVPGSPRSLQAVDLNRDGRVDLAASSRTTASLTVLFQTPSGFSPLGEGLLSMPVSTPSPPFSVSGGDFTGDGVSDLACTSLNDFGRSRGSIVVFPQENWRGFQPTPDVILATGHDASVRSLEIADFDHDGRQDLIAASGMVASDSQVLLFRQTSPGLFAATPTSRLLGESVREPSDLIVADSNGDRRYDLLCVNRANAPSPPFSSVSFFLQAPNSPGILPRTPGIALTDASLRRPQAAVFADLDHDAQLDVATLSRGGFTTPPILAIFRRRPASHGELAFTDPIVLTPALLGGSGTFEDALFLRAAPLNGDEFLDFAAVTETRVSLIFAPLGGFTRAGGMLIDLGGVAAPAGLAAGDFDDDGRFDVAVLDQNTHDVRIFLQGDGFVSGQLPDIVMSFADNVTLRAIATGDLDRDGDLDLVIGSVGTHRVHVFLQPTTGFSPGQTSTQVLGTGTSNSDEVALVVADIDGDEELDIAYSGVPGEIWVFFGNHR